MAFADGIAAAVMVAAQASQGQHNGIRWFDTPNKQYGCDRQARACSTGCELTGS